jgi:hypothetical protein
VRATPVRGYAETGLRIRTASPDCPKVRLLEGRQHPVPPVELWNLWKLAQSLYAGEHNLKLIPVRATLWVAAAGGAFRNWNLCE